MNTEELSGLGQERCNQAMRRGQGSDSAASRAWTLSPLDREIYLELAQAYTFLPGLIEHYLARQELPIKRELAVLFVDLADSTNAVLRQSPEMALAAVQRFMRVVTEIALAHCGDVKDYEGDGALLYFASIAAAARAALAIQAALAAERSTRDTFLQARLSLNVGEVVIGVIGSPLRRSVALIGPAVSLAARLLKQIPPGGIIAPQAAVEKLHEDAPDLAERFQVWGECLTLKGFEEECVTAYYLTGDVAAARGQALPCHQKSPRSTQLPSADTGRKLLPLQ